MAAAMWRIGTFRSVSVPLIVLALSLALVTGCRRFRSHRRANPREQFANACYKMAKPARLSLHADPIPQEIETSFFPEGSLLRTREQLDCWTPPARFPQDWQSEAHRLDDIERESLNGLMSGMREPSLARSRPEIEKAFRLTVLESFRLPVAVRAVKTAAGAFLVVRGEGTNDLVVHELGVGQWRCLDSLVEDARFWQRRAIEGWIVPDGSQWVLEGAAGSKYHVVSRFSSVNPDSADKLMRLCWYLMRLAGARRHTAHE